MADPKRNPLFFDGGDRINGLVHLDLVKAEKLKGLTIAVCVTILWCLLVRSTRPRRPCTSLTSIVLPVKIHAGMTAVSQEEPFLDKLGCMDARIGERRQSCWGSTRPRSPLPSRVTLWLHLVQRRHQSISYSHPSSRSALAHIHRPFTVRNCAAWRAAGE